MPSLSSRCLHPIPSNLILFSGHLVATPSELWSPWFEHQEAAERRSYVGRSIAHPRNLADFTPVALQIFGLGSEEDGDLGPEDIVVG